MAAKKSHVIALALALVLLSAPSAAFASLSGRIYENKGVKTARLGLHDSTNDHRIGSPWKRIKDTDYSYVVWEYRFGSKSKTTGKYPIKMLSMGSTHHVFYFEIWSSRFVTSNGTHVGTTESALVARYGSRIKKAAGSLWTEYWMGTRSGRTGFWVQGGKIRYIVIERY